MSYIFFIIFAIFIEKRYSPRLSFVKETGLLIWYNTFKKKKDFSEFQSLEKFREYTILLHK